MAFLKFNKSELVNLEYSLKREIIEANETGAYCNTSIVTCNTRRYHGLLAVPIEEFGGGKYMLLSALDESLVLRGKRFNLGIHCYGDTYEPRGHKYIVDFDADPVPVITYKVGGIVFTKTIMMVPGNNQVLVKYELLEAPSKLTLLLNVARVFAFRVPVLWYFQNYTNVGVEAVGMTMMISNICVGLSAVAVAIPVVIKILKKAKAEEDTALAQK